MTDSGNTVRKKYRSFYLGLRDSKVVDDTLDAWSEKGWVLHSSSITQLGEGYGSAPFGLFVFQRDWPEE